MTVIHVGIDLGSTRMRAAYAARGDVAKVVSVAGAAWPWILCEPVSAGAVPMSFPSLKSRLGIEAQVTSNGLAIEPAEVVAKALDTVRAEIVREPGLRVGHTVISVPARFFTSQRAALLTAAADAGLTDVSLVTDSVASVIDQTAGERTGTYLVYGMGYGGHELGLVRAVRGTYRVLGYDGAAAPSGDTLDGHVLGSWLTALARRGVTHDDDTAWPWLRQLAEQVKWRLAAGESVLFPHAVPVPGGVLHVQFDESSFNRQVRAMITGTLDEVTALLAAAELDTTAIDLVVLSGGSTGMPALREAVDSLARPVSAAEAGHLARGALRHAQELGRRPTPSYDPSPSEASSGHTERTTQTTPLSATVLTAPTQLADAARTPALRDVSRLINEGRTDAARTALRAVITEAQTMLYELDAVKQDRSGATPAKELIATARTLLAEGNHRNAIAIAHMAWRKDLYDVDVFENMLDLHCAAAMANPTTTSFETDEHWLRCALHHDPTNGRIRELLAERNYLQAKDLLRTGKKPEAARFLQAALKWVPDQPEATAALRDLNTRRTP